MEQDWKWNGQEEGDQKRFVFRDFETGRTITVLYDVPDLFSLFGGFSSHLYGKSVAYYRRNGHFSSWMKRLGEEKLATLLQPFERGGDSDYGFVVQLFYESIHGKKKDFSSVVGYAKARQTLLEMTTSNERHSSLSDRYGIEDGGGVLLYGPPGCGKTLIAQSVAGETGKHFVQRSIGDVLEDGRGFFELLKKIKNVVIFVDEMEGIASHREMEGLRSQMLPNQLLTVLDRDLFEKGVAFIGATNSPWQIDPAIIRSGRLDHMVYVGTPDLQTRRSLLEFYTRSTPCEGVDLEDIAKRTDFYSCSDIEAVCKFARAVPWREAVLGGPERPVGPQDFEQALKSCPSTIGPWFEAASSVMFGAGQKARFGDMLEEIERYKAARKER